MKIEIDTDQIWKIIESMLTFSYPQICRHSVICTIASEIFDKNDVYENSDEYADFCKQVVSSKDYEAIECMKKIRN
ncbi:MAG: hypothetical protein P8Y23_01905 [Candidatus Lokiarchaeota archaeon]